MSFTDWFKDIKPVMPVMVIEDINDAEPLAEALISGGVTCLEITLRTPVGLKAIEILAKKFPDAHVGVGTVSKIEEMQRAVDAGAKFAISPGITADLCEKAKSLRLPYAPGIMTPSDILVGKQFGMEFFKFYPADLAGGPKMLKALQGPFPDLKFCPTGGIHYDNAMEYLSLKNVVAVGGSWVCPVELVRNKDWQAIKTLAKKALPNI